MAATAAEPHVNRLAQLEHEATDRVAELESRSLNVFEAITTRLAELEQTGAIQAESLRTAASSHRAEVEGAGSTAVARLEEVVEQHTGEVADAVSASRA
ncbi:MAG: hypothetical protein L0206_05085, partial [Actinobacteria bacterium]|nr:hypothetical protein [Actinomycetota bacterium]